MNKVILIGNVGMVNSRQVGDAKVVSFSLATSEKYTNRSGETVENTTWHSVVVWGKTADFVEKYVTKGSKLCVEGRIQNRKYTTNSGEERMVTEIRADSVQNLTPKKGDAPAPADDDLPFD